MFEIVDDSELTLTATVDCEYPLKGNKKKLIAFDIEFERPEGGALTDLLNAARTSDMRVIGGFVKTHLVGWTNFNDAKGVSVPFNDENLEQVSRDSALAVAVGAAMANAANGGAKAKNSSARRVGTQKS